MVKKRSNLKVVTSPESSYGTRLRNTPSRSMEKSLASSNGSQVANVVGTQIFSSKEQALEVLLDQLVSRLEDDSSEREDMKAFLADVLETDPVLKEEVLSGVSIRR